MKTSAIFKLLSRSAAALSFVALIFGFSACQAEPGDISSNSDSIAFGVSTGYGDDVATKTEYSGKDENGADMSATSQYERIDWISGKDRIRVVCEAAQDGPIKDYAISGNPTAEGEKSLAKIAPVTLTDLKWGTGDHYFYALYPAPGTESNYDFTDNNPVTEENSNIAVGGDKTAVITAVIPESQEAVLVGDIYKTNMNYAYMYAQTKTAAKVNEVPLMFKPLVTTYEFQISGVAGDLMSSNLVALQLSSESVSLAGEFDVYLADGYEPVVSPAATPTVTSVTVNLPGEGVLLTADRVITVTMLALPTDQTDLKLTLMFADQSTRSMKLKDGAAYINVPACKKVYFSNVKVPGTVFEAVDLGLPSGLKWANLNLGASKLEEYGDYYAWGETEPYYSSLDPLTWKDGKSAGYDWASYSLCNGSSTTFTKYNTDSSLGTVDNKTVLDAEDDAAHVKLGGSWRMPTDAEWTELRTECTWEWTTQNGVNGRLVTGPNGNSIFLPAATFGYKTNRPYPGSSGDYWSSSLDTGYPNYAWYVRFNSDDVHRGGRLRFDGQSVRPVNDEGVRVSVTSISLDKASLSIVAGGTATLTATVAPSNATQPAVIWSSSNTAAATVNYNGVVTAVAAGSATITATTYDGGKTATCTVTVVAAPEAVDLGLPSGLKWASFNLGATVPEGYGDYYAWGETEPYYTNQTPLAWKDDKSAGYWWPSYKFDLGTDQYGPFSKYVTTSSYGTVDNKTVLEPEDDAAHVKLGGSWRMPTSEEWAELMNTANCTWVWETLNGIYGYKVTSKKTGYTDRWIFLPAAGYWYKTELYYTSSAGYYWSSTLSSARSDFGLYADFFSEGIDRVNLARCVGNTIRPVK